MTPGILALAVALAGIAAERITDEAHDARPDESPVAAVEARAGTIGGVVTLEPPPRPRRNAQNYRRGGTQVRTFQPVQPVVYLRGAISGASADTGEPPRMVQQDTVFAPSALVVEVGTTVAFPNGDDFHHNVFSYSEAKTFDLGRYPRGESKDLVFDEVGIVEISCEVHESMRGLIVVTENPFHAVVAEDGSFEITGVPAGEYTLVAFHPDYEVMEQPVTVTDGGTVRIEVELLL